MRFLVQARIPVEHGNAAIKDGSLLSNIQKYLDQTKPEAVYFSSADGQRTIFFVLNIEAEHNLPEIYEPLWLDLHADLQVYPVLNAADFAKAGPGIERVVASRR